MNLIIDLYFYAVGMGIASIVLYFVIKKAVKDAIIEAKRELQ